MDGGSFENLKKLYFFLDQNFDDLIAKCTKDDQRKQLRQDYVVARDCFYKARNLIFHDDDGGALTAIMLQPNGTRFGGWRLNTADNVFGPVADYDGDGHAEIFVASPWGVGIIKLSGSSMTALMLQPNGTRFGGWLLNTKDNRFSLAADFNGDGAAEVFASSPWGVGILKWAGDSLNSLMLQPNGTRFGGWLLNTGDNHFLAAGRIVGGAHPTVLVTSPWGIGVLELNSNSMVSPMLQPNGTRFGGWLLNTADNTM